MLCLVCLSLVGNTYHWPSWDFYSIFIYVLSPPMVQISSLKCPDLLGSLNCNCDLVAHSSLPMDLFAHGDTIPMIFYVVYDMYSDISYPHELCYRVMKVLHQIGRKIHGFIHDMAATHNADFVESFDVILERVCRDIVSMVDYAIISEYACRKINSYDAPL